MTDAARYVLLVVTPYGYSAYSKSVRTPGGSTKSTLDGRFSRDGALLLDLRPVAKNDPAGYKSLLLNGPLVDVDLAPGEVEECPPPSPMLLAGLTGSFKTMATALSEGWEGLNSVSKETYAAKWAELGARVARKRGPLVICGGDTHKILKWLEAT